MLRQCSVDGSLVDSHKDSSIRADSHSRLKKSSDTFKNPKYLKAVNVSSLYYNS